MTESIDPDIELNSMEPIYFYTRLAELKIEMIARAIQDALSKAEQIAKNARSKLADLKNVNMRVFQITGQNSAEEFSSGSTFNTSSKNKMVSITIRLEFGID